MRAMSMTAFEIVSMLDGPNAAGRFFDVSPPSVIGWLRASAIPEGRLIERAAELEKAYPERFNRKAQWPHKFEKIWPELAAATAPEIKPEQPPAQQIRAATAIGAITKRAQA